MCVWFGAEGVVGFVLYDPIIFTDFILQRRSREGVEGDDMADIDSITSSFVAVFLIQGRNREGEGDGMMWLTLVNNLIVCSCFPHTRKEPGGGG